LKKTKDEQMSIDGTQEAEMLARLAERVERAVTTITDLRRERDELKDRLQDAEGGLEEREEERQRLTELEEENERFRSERDAVRSRIESLLEKLDALEEAPAEEE
jgi:FtsZ-binding cell division protein ZapB